MTVSDLPPNQAAPLSLQPEPSSPESEALFEAAMAAMAAEPEPVEAEAPVLPEESAQPEAPAEAGTAATTPQVVAEAPKPATSAEPPPRLAPALLKLAEREAAIVEREARLKAAEADLSALRTHVDSFETARNKFKFDPVGFIRSMAPDVDLADLAKTLWYEKLGDSAPADYRATRAERAAKGSIEELRAELKQTVEAERQRWVEEQQRQQAETAYHQYVGALGALTKDVPGEYPLVKSYASSDPEGVQRGLLKIAQKHAQATGGEVLTPAECAARLNKELERLRSALGVSSPTPAPTPAPTKNAAPPVSTLRNKHTSVQPNRTLPDASDEDAKFDLAMQAVQATLKSE